MKTNDDTKKTISINIVIICFNFTLFLLSVEMKCSHVEKIKLINDIFYA